MAERVRVREISNEEGNRLPFELLASCGLRISEAIALQRLHLHSMPTSQRSVFLG